jgi:hypothetical protein
MNVPRHVVDEFNWLDLLDEERLQAEQPVPFLEGVRVRFPAPGYLILVNKDKLAGVRQQFWQLPLVSSQFFFQRHGYTSVGRKLGPKWGGFLLLSLSGFICIPRARLRPTLDDVKQITSPIGIVEGKMEGNIPINRITLLDLLPGGVRL